MQRALPELSSEAPDQSSELAPELVRALNETDCLAARTAIDTVEVFAPWLLEGGDRSMPAPSCSSSSRPGAASPQFRAMLLDAASRAPQVPSRPPIE
jgi:hypothetical protein